MDMYCNMDFAGYGVPMLEKNKKVIEDNRGAYGSPKVTTNLREQGEIVNRRRVARLMRENGIAGSTEPKWKGTTELRRSS